MSTRKNELNFAKQTDFTCSYLMLLFPFDDLFLLASTCSRAYPEMPLFVVMGFDMTKMDGSERRSPVTCHRGSFLTIADSEVLSC